MQVDCIYNQEQAVDVTGAPAADLLSDMKTRYTAVLVQGVLLQAPSAPSFAVVCNKCLLAESWAHIAEGLCECRGVEDLQDSCRACFDNINRFHCLQTVSHALTVSHSFGRSYTKNRTPRYHPISTVHMCSRYQSVVVSRRQWRPLFFQHW